MLKKEHIKQASIEKVTKFTDELYTDVMNHINESSGYLNDTEQVMSTTILGNRILNACIETIGEESVKLIMEHFKSTKEKEYEREKDNQKEWSNRII